MKNLVKFLPIVFGMVNVESCQNAMQMHNNNLNMALGQGMMNGMGSLPINQNMNMNNGNINNNLNNQFMMHGNNLMMQPGQNSVQANPIQNMILNTFNLLTTSKTLTNNKQLNVSNNTMINGNIKHIQNSLGEKQNGNQNVNNKKLNDSIMQYMESFLTPELDVQLTSKYQNANNSTDVSVDIDNSSLFKAHLSRAYQIIAQNGCLGLSHAGLTNIGATCYMNGTIQAFANELEFLKSFFKSVVKHYDTLKNMNNNDAILTLEFANIIAELWNRAFPDNIYEHKQSGIRDLAPRKFKAILSTSNPLFQGVQANDSKDLLLHLLETMHRALNQKNPKAVFNTNDPDFNSFANDYYSNNSSPILNNFYYVQKNNLKCCNCGHTTNNYVAMNIFISPLEKIRKSKARVNNNSPLTTYDCITDAPELLTGQNQIYCNNCRQNSNAMNCNTFHSLPNTLPIILNRGIGLQFTVPLQLQDVVDFGEYVNTVKDDAKYFLSSIVVHHGNSGMDGHFVNISRASPTSPWIMYNDGVVSIARQDIVDSILNNNNNLGNVPYILFYKKRSDADLSSDLDTLCNEMKNKQNMSQDEIIYKQKMINEIQGAMLSQLGRDSAKIPAMPVGMNMAMTGQNMMPINNQNFNNNVNNNINMNNNNMINNNQNINNFNNNIICNNTSPNNNMQMNNLNNMQNNNRPNNFNNMNSNQINNMNMNRGNNKSIGMNNNINIPNNNMPDIFQNNQMNIINNNQNRRNNLNNINNNKQGNNIINNQNININNSNNKVLNIFNKKNNNFSNQNPNIINNNIINNPIGNINSNSNMINALNKMQTKTNKAGFIVQSSNNNKNNNNNNIINNPIGNINSNSNMINALNKMQTKTHKAGFTVRSNNNKNNNNQEVNNKSGVKYNTGIEGITIENVNKIVSEAKFESYWTAAQKPDVTEILEILSYWFQKLKQEYNMPRNSIYFNQLLQLSIQVQKWSSKIVIQVSDINNKPNWNIISKYSNNLNQSNGIITGKQIAELCLEVWADVIAGLEKIEKNSKVQDAEKVMDLKTSIDNLIPFLDNLGFKFK